MTMARDPAAAFSTTYAQARERFVAAARDRGLAIETHTHPTQRGAQGEDLAIDVALLGRPDARDVLLLTSGTHGAEGFCGSGCQIGFLADDDLLRAAERRSVRVVFLHALNPYGFSHVRRTNEDNIDLNRNFRDFTHAPEANTAYAQVHGFMVPDTWPPTPANEGRLQAYVKEHGQFALQQATTSGQCEFRDGLFYGGVRPAFSNLVLRDVLRRHAGTARRLGWIDFHTGLGPSGHGEKIYNGRDVAADIARSKAWWGADVTSFHDGSSTSASLTGVNHEAAYDECPQAAYAAIALEYGTLPVMDVLQALRADQWLENHPDAPAEQRASIKAMVRAAFHDDSPEWQRKVYAQAVVAFEAALAGLSAP